MNEFIIFVLHLAIYGILMQQTVEQELLINGNFSQNNCSSTTCFYNTTANTLAGWIPDPDIEISSGSIYNSRLGSAKALQLAVYRNGCLKQIVFNLQPGIYQLKYVYAARDKIVFDNCRFIVKFNTKQLREIIPTDYLVNTDTVEFANYNLSNGEIRFCSTGIYNDGTGAILVSASLVKARDLPTQSSSFNSSRFVIDSHSEKVFQNEYQFDYGPLQISFHYLVVSTVFVKQSAVIVKFDGNEIYKVTKCQSNKNIQVQIPGTALKGVHNLSFTAVGSPNQGLHQILISNVVISQTQCVGSGSGDLIVNGNFSNNACGSDLCIWHVSNYTNNVPGWTPNTWIQLGRALTYNPDFTTSQWVVELDVYTNQCIRQAISNIQAGRHEVAFNWIQRPGLNFASGGVEVKLNGNSIGLVTPSDYILHNKTIHYQLTAPPPTISFLDFCGAGTSDTAGSVLSNIQMFSYYRCQSTKVFLY